MSLPGSDAGWLELIRAGVPAFGRVFAGVGGGSLIERDGVLGTVMPATPERSLFNSVSYRAGAGPTLLGALDELAAAYRQAGIRAWTVWVPEADRFVAGTLAERGHTLDGAPRAMGMEIAAMAPPSVDPQLRITDAAGQAAAAELAAINEIAFGVAPGDFDPLAKPMPGTRIYFGELDNERVACAMAFDHGADCEITFVGVLPEARGHGISGRLIAHALGEATARGQVTTTLQASPLGRPVYIKLGYRDFGALQMWELREPSGDKRSP